MSSWCGSRVRADTGSNSSGADLASSAVRPARVSLVRNAVVRSSRTRFGNGGSGMLIKPSSLCRAIMQQTVTEEANNHSELAYYYPNPFWYHGDWVKSLILFFDGIAILVPTYMKDRVDDSDPAIVSGLRKHGLLHVIEPETTVDDAATYSLANSMTDIIASGVLDGITATNTAFHELSMSRLGFYGDEGLAQMILGELKSRNLARDTEDGVSIPMHPMVRSLILTLLAQIMRARKPIDGHQLSPVTDRPMLVNALDELLSSPMSGARDHVVSFDLATVGVDLGPVPIDEVLAFRKEHHKAYRRYRSTVRTFMAELSQMDPNERPLAFEDRQQKLDDLAADLRRVSHQAWKKPCALAMGLTGAYWTMTHGVDPIGAIVSAASAIAGFDKAPKNDAEAFSYLFQAAQKF